MKVMCIGEAYGREEEAANKPFVGMAGKLLRECLASVGIDPEHDVHYTNLINKRPPNNELRPWFDSHGVPNEDVTRGLLSLREEINAINPNLIIPLGNYPLRYVTGKGKWGKEGPTGIGDYRGYLLEGNAFTGGRKCLPVYHPAAALRQYPLKHIIRTDLAKAKRLAQTPALERPRKCIVVDPRGADRDAWANWLVSPEGTPSPNGSWPAMEGCPPVEGQMASGAFLSADIEYIGSKLLCIGFTRHRDVAVVFPTPSIASIGFIRDILLSGVPLCFQNAMFDCSILEWFYDIPALKYLGHDTMYMMHAAYIEMQKDLGFIGSLFTDLPPWWQHVNGEFWKGVREGTRPILDVLPYNGGDVLATHEGADSLLADELRDPDILRTYQHEMSLVPPLWDMSRRGVRIDTAKLGELKSRLQVEADAIAYGLQKLNDGVEINVKSSPQVAKFIYDKMEVPRVGPKTPGGAWKMDDTTLAKLQLACPHERQRTAIKMVRETRERRDLISKFCEIELDEDGRMRCHYDPAKTKTGRLGSRQFYPTGRGSNLQNVPRDIRVRAVFVPDPGRVFGYADLKSAESFVVAHITGDAEMLRLHSAEFMDGTSDGHKYVASFLLDRAIEKITKDERYLGKRVRHAGNYGMSWRKLMDIVNADAQTTGVSIDAAQAKMLIHKYRQLHPGLGAWWNSIQAELWQSHSLLTLHRRKRVFYDRPDAILPEAIAYGPQGTVADTLNMGLLQVAASPLLAELGFETLLQVHDAIGFQVPERHTEVAVRELTRLLDIPITIIRRGLAPYEIHIPVEFQIGYNWGESDEDPKRPGSGLQKDGKPAVNPNGLRTYHAPAAA